MDSLIEMPPEEDPENMPSATEELLQIMEDFADYIDKFMFEIVTFLAVVDSAMGLIKDVLGLFGFEGWKMAFFPTFSFIVTTGVFLFGAKKRKGKRDSDVPEGLAEAFDAFEDVMEVVEDVAEGLEDIDQEGGGDEGDLGNVLGDVVGSSVSLPIGSIAGEMQGTGDGNGNEADANASNTPADGNQNIARKVIAVAVLAAGIIAKLKKRRGGDQEEESPTKEATGGGEGSSRDVEKQEIRMGLETPQGNSQQNEWQSGKSPAITGAASLNAVNRKALASTSCGLNDSVIIDLNLADHGKRFAEADWQNAVKSNVISGERQLRWNSRQLARGVKQGASEIKRGIEEASFRETSIHTEESSRGITHLDEDNQHSEKQFIPNPLEMASGMVKNTTDLAGSAVQSVDQQTRKGVEETRKKSGSILHIAIRLVRLIVRVVDKKKGGSSTGSQKSEESTEKAASSDAKGSMASLESDSVYFDCLSSTPQQTQRFTPTYASCKSVMSTGTQTDRENMQPQYRSEPQILYQDSTGMFFNEPRRSPWNSLRRSVLSMPDTALMEMREAADEEMRLRGKPSEQMKMVAETITLRPAWLSSRDDIAGRISKEISRNKETLLHVASPHSRSVASGPSYDEYKRIPHSLHLDAPVILHQAKDSKAPNLREFQESGTVSLHGSENTQNAPRSFQDAERLEAGAKNTITPESTGRGDPADRDLGECPRLRSVLSSSIPERDKGQRTPNDDLVIDDEGPVLDGERFAKSGSTGRHVVRDRGKGPGVHKGQSARYDWAINGEGPDLDEKRYAKVGRSGRGVRNHGKNPRERNIRSSSSYEGLEEYEDRSQPDLYSRAKSASQRSTDYRPSNLRRSVSYELTEDDSVFEREDPYHDGVGRSERSASNNRFAPRTNGGKQPRNTTPSKSRHHSRLKLFEQDHDEASYFPRGSERHSPVTPTESSGSVESSRNQRRSNMSLSSVRFADEEPSVGFRNGGVSRSSSKKENSQKYLSQQSTKQKGPRDSRRKIASNGRWNSAVCLTGHQKDKMLASLRGPYMNDNYISDETGSSQVPQVSRTGINRGPSFNRLGRGPSTIIRTRSANYLGDDESNEQE